MLGQEDCSKFMMILDYKKNKPQPPPAPPPPPNPEIISSLWHIVPITKLLNYRQYEKRSTFRQKGWGCLKIGKLLL